MTEESNSTSTQSLHYTVKAFLFSAPLRVKLERAEDLKRVHLYSTFKFPSALGRKREYELGWTYLPSEVEIAEVWAEKPSQPVRAERSPQKLDLVQLFWGGHSREDGPTPSQPSQVLWRRDDILCRDFQRDAEGFSFRLEKRGSDFVSAEGRFGPDGLLQNLKLALSLPIKLGTVTVERAGGLKNY